jgi:hypothetical protein
MFVPETVVAVPPSVTTRTTAFTVGAGKVTVTLVPVVA